MNPKETNSDTLSKQILELKTQITQLRAEFEAKFQDQAKEIAALKKTFRIARGEDTTRGR